MKFILEVKLFQEELRSQEDKFTVQHIHSAKLKRPRREVHYLNFPAKSEVAQLTADCM